MSQLRMEKIGLSDIPDVPVPEGYLLRNFRDGDEADLARIYRESKLDKDTVEIVRADILGDPCFAPERVFVAEIDGQVVGTGSAWRVDDEPDAGYLHMLGVLHEHRGKRLGLLLTCAALRHTRDEGFNIQRLMTDDWREAAIRMYLQLGYDPLITDSSHPERWKSIALKIGRTDAISRMRPFTQPREPFMRRLRRVFSFGSLFPF